MPKPGTGLFAPYKAAPTSRGTPLVPATAPTGKGAKGGKGAATGPAFLSEGFVHGFKLWLRDMHFKTDREANQTVARWLADANCHPDDQNISEAKSVMRAGQYWGVLSWRDPEKCRTAYGALREETTRDNTGHPVALFVKYKTADDRF